MLDRNGYHISNVIDTYYYYKTMYFTDTKWLQAKKTIICWLQLLTSEQHIPDMPFSTITDFQRDPSKAYLKQWVDPSSAMMYNKTSTCILLTNEKKFSKFGFDAEAKYLDLILDKKQKDWYFFRRFKMYLYDIQVSS